MSVADASITAPAPGTKLAGLLDSVSGVFFPKSALVNASAATINPATSEDMAAILAALGGSVALPLGTDRSGNATTLSGVLHVSANAARKGLFGQNVGVVPIAYNEFGGTAALNTAGSYTVAAGGTFEIRTQNLVNFIADSGTPGVTLTEF